MKRIAALIMLLSLLFFLFGCDFNSATKQVPLIAPINLKLFDETLTWDTVTDASGYVILINDQPHVTLDTNTYTFIDEISEDQSVTIKAVRQNEEGEDEYSPSSISITRYKTIFTTNEIMILNFKDYGSTNGYVDIADEFEVPASIRYLKIEGKPTDTYLNVSFLINNRNIPLTIDIINFNGVGCVNKPMIYTNAELTESWWVTINSLGENNKLTGGPNHLTGTQGSNATTIFMIGGDGGTGPKGYPALNLPNVILKGNADIDMIGGRGGNGGNGGNGFGNYGGDGGNGGIGGSGAVFANFYVKLDSTTSINFQGAIGGEGGRAGNSTLLTAPLNGKIGKTGQDYEGSLTRISGIVG